MPGQMLFSKKGLLEKLDIKRMGPIISRWMIVQIIQRLIIGGILEMEEIILRRMSALKKKAESKRCHQVYCYKAK